jgi:hypothetical protein
LGGLPGWRGRHRESEAGLRRPGRSRVFLISLSIFLPPSIRF